MAVKRFGTNSISGLNVGTAGHLIADHELQTSIGGWTKVDGAWSTGRNHLTVHSGSAISCMAVGRMAGQDHTVYMDGNTLYDTGSAVGTITMGSDFKRIVPIDGKFLILGAADGKNKVYDGDHVRDHGAWQSDFVGTSSSAGIAAGTAAATYTVDAGAGGITKATEAKIYLTSVASLSVGMPVYLTGVLGMAEINGKGFTITSIDTDGTPNWITIDCDSSGFTTYTSGGTLYRQASGLDGDYKFAVATTVELASGVVIEGPLVMMGSDISGTGFYHSGDEAETITMVPTETRVFKLNILSWILSSVAQYNISGTIGVDFFPGLRLYRTKDAGVGDFYLEKSFRHGDTGFTYTSGAGYGYYTANYFIHVADRNLGSLYAAGQYDHSAPPTSSLAAQVGQRIFMNDADNPDRVYVAGLDGFDYVNPTDWMKLPDSVTVMRKVRDRLVVGTPARWYLVDMISGYPQIMELDASTGTIYPDAVTSSDEGLFFVKETGIYQLDLARVNKINRRAILESDLDAGQAAIITNDTAIFVCDPQGASSTAVARIRDGGWVWHTDRSVLQHTHFGRNSYGQVLGALPTKIEVLFTGSSYYGSFQGKIFSDGDTWRTTKLLLDIQGTGTYRYNVQTNRGAVFASNQLYTSTTNERRILQLPLDRKPAETFSLTLACTGDIDVYGYAIEVEA